MDDPKELVERIEETGQAEEEPAAGESSLPGVFLAFALLLLVHFGPAIEGLDRRSQSILAVFLWFISAMVMGALPRAIAGLGAPLLIVLLTGAKVTDAFRAFTTDVFFLGGGTFIVAGILTGTGLGRRIALTIVALLRSDRVVNIFLGVGLADLAAGAVVPSAAEGALFLPVARSLGSLIQRAKGPRASRLSTALLFQTPGITPLFTGTLILTSHFPNIILAVTLQETEGIHLSWLDWLWLNLPLWGLLPVAFLYVFSYFGLWRLRIPGASEDLPRLKAELGPITWPETWSLICLLLGLVLWITEGLHGIPSGMVALIVVVLLFMPWSGLTFGAICPHVMWDTWVLLGGSTSLGLALFDSGAVLWLSRLILEPLQGLHLSPLPLLLLLVFALQVPRAGMISSAAMGSAFVPLVLGMAHTLGMNVLPFSLVAINCLSYALFLPFSITAFLIAWSASGASGWEAVRFGAPLSIIANIYVILVQTAWLSFIGQPLLPGP